MKFTLSWLKEHLDTDASLTEITDRLTAIGLELEGVENPADVLRPFKVARVIEAGPHPNADKLRLLKVDDGSGGSLSTGASPEDRRCWRVSWLGGVHVVKAPRED